MQGAGGERRARGRTGLTATLVVVLGAAAFAPSAWADGDMPAPPAPVAGDLDAGDAVDVDAIVDDVVAAVSDVASEPAPTVETGDTAGDTAPGITDSAEGSGSPTAPAQASSPVSVQIDPANLNVSVRIDSPGEDGAVAQSNTAVAATQPAAATASARTSPGTAPKSSEKSPPASAGASQEASSSLSPDPPGTWQWTWDCASPPDVQPPELRDADGELLTWNWTWIWNCAGNTEGVPSGAAQYQSGTGNDTTGQYQPANVNVSIRISSPGDNGPVSQSNVAISVGVPAAAGASEGQAGRVSVHVDVQVPGVADALPSSATSGSADGPIDVVRDALIDIEHLIDSFGFPAGDDLKALVGFPCSGCAPAASLSAGSLPAGPCGDAGRGVLRKPGSVRGELWSQRCLEAPLGVAPCRCLPPVPPKGTGGALSSIWASVASSSVSERAGAARSSKPNRAKPVLDRPTQRIPAPTGVSGAALGAAPAGSSSSGSLPVSLLIPLFVGLLDICRRVAVTKVTLPTGLSGGTFDPPG